VKKFLGVIFFGSLLLASCGVAHQAVMVPYHVATAPVKLARWALEDPAPTPPPRNTDVDLPGRPVETSSPKPRSSTKAKAQSSRTPSPTTKTKTTAASGQPPEFPLARPVPGKAGYVYSPYDPTKYVDVSGYASGSKVKDPFVHKIFIVP